MTFEEVKTKLDSGAVGTLQDVAEMLTILIEARRTSGIYIAIALYESRRLYQGAGWGSWAQAQYHFSDEKKAFHRANVGEMLRALEKDQGKLHGRFMSQGITLLETWARLFNAGKRLEEKGELDSPCTVIRNFLKAHPDAFSWKREKLDLEIVKFLYPEKEFEQGELNLRFDAIGSQLSDSDLVALTQREDFDGCRAFIMANNGAKLCLHAADVILQDNDQLPAEALEDIDNALESVHRKLRGLLQHKREQ